MATGKWIGGWAAGLAAGAAATALMDAYWAGIGKLKANHSGTLSSNEEPATVKVARLALAKAGVRHPSSQVRTIAGNAVHWGYGVFLGGVAGLAGQLGVPLHWGGGQLFGAGLWAAGDVWLLYRLGLAKHPREYPARLHLEALGAHLAYGAGLWATLEAMRAVTGAIERRVGTAEAEPAHEAA